MNLLAVFLFFLMFFTPAEAANTQGHPFSQIYYIDTNFNMSAYNITNVSYVGVGISSPAYPLDVAGAGRITNNLYVGGTLGVGTISPQNALNVIGDINATGNIYGTLGSGTVNTTSIIDSAVTDAKISEVNWIKLQNYPSACGSGKVVQGIDDTLACVNISELVETVGNVSGSGSLDYIPVWTGAETLGNSFIYQSGGLLYTTTGIVVGGTIDLNDSYSIINATYVNATNIYAGGNAVLTTATIFGGNVSGTYSNAQLALNSVGASQIINGSIDSSKLVPDLNLAWANLTNFPANCSAGQVATGFNDTHIICTSSGTGEIGGIGTLNYLAKFTENQAIGNSAVYEENGLVGIGVAVSLTNPLNINASASGSSIALIGRASDNASSIDFLDSARTSAISIKRNGTALGITGGNVGVGTMTPNSTLHVAGNITVTPDSDVCIDGGNCLSSRVASIFYNKTATTYTGSLSYSSLTGYKAGDAICNAEFSGTHLCSMAEISFTIATQNLSSISGWAGEAWIATGPAKYSPASLPVNDCNGFTHGAAGSYLGNWWSFDQSTGGVGKTGQCGNTLRLGCCK
ncbi:MAG: hypothetical protein ABIF85_04555 [Nanoarchaeota archaeon]|nr:hypothetical protein [Nanoarchaeota archaeon]MBU4452472.1 hypothetical protein [Nanoarchaeota archaeon]MCG2724002.1 hypothetical protein [archaeon]